MSDTQTEPAWGRITIVIAALALLTYAAPDFVFGLIPIVLLLLLMAVIISVFQRGVTT